MFYCFLYIPFNWFNILITSYYFCNLTRTISALWHSIPFVPLISHMKTVNFLNFNLSALFYVDNDTKLLLTCFVINK